MFIRDLLRELADKKVPYCVVGGVAVNLHGVPRMTYDIDLVVPTTWKLCDRSTRCSLDSAFSAGYR